ncbi:hypothetical protein IVA95_29885 [Bradyrhizobium sp. 157]|nr:hypothetical protein [Bradyrhizobium sp. 157]MCK1641640.1 hypothetical protein [Bradyrhizobium sp. 157]
MDDPDRPEIEHFGNCPVCGELIDMRELAQVIAHMHATANGQTLGVNP